ncbi:MAG: hypothetical protein AABW85_05630, partial [archaeon]
MPIEKPANNIVFFAIAVLILLAIISAILSNPAGNQPQNAGANANISPVPVEQVPQNGAALFEVNEGNCASGEEAVPKVGFLWKWGEIDGNFCGEKFLDETQFSICLLKKMHSFLEKTGGKIGYCGDGECNEAPLACSPDCRVNFELLGKGDKTDFGGKTRNDIIVKSVLAGV